VKRHLAVTRERVLVLKDPEAEGATDKLVGSLFVWPSISNSNFELRSCWSSPTTICPSYVK
jgi:hypothetical protein